MRKRSSEINEKTGEILKRFSKETLLQSLDRKSGKGRPAAITPLRRSLFLLQLGVPPREDKYDSNSLPANLLVPALKSCNL
eukprot:c21689_g1_i2 orf=701-943(-)